MFPTAAEVSMKLNTFERHEIFLKNPQVCSSMVANGIAVKPTRKSDTAKERRIRLVGVWRCLQREIMIIADVHKLISQH